MIVLFCTSDQIAARCIRGITWSDWSHAGIVDGDEIIEAVYPRVKSTPIEEVLAKHGRYCFVDIPCPDEEAAISAAREQIGKPYDLKGMLGLGFNRDWQKDSDWWCSELVAYAATIGGAKLFREGVLHRITPQHLWMLDYQVLIDSNANSGRSNHQLIFKGCRHEGIQRNR